MNHQNLFTLLSRRILIFLCVLACQGSLSAQIEILPSDVIDSLIKRSKTDSLSMYERANLALRARDLARARADLDRSYQASLSAGIAYISVSAYDQSLACFQDAFMAAQEEGLAQRQAESSFYIGEVHMMLDQLTNSSKFYQTSFEQYQEIQATFWLAIVLNSMGVVQSKQKQFAEARSYYQRSLEMFQSGGFVRESSMSISNLGEYYIDSGAPEKAVPYFEEALQIAQETKIRRAETIYLANLGKSFQAMGDYSKAIEYFNLSLQKSIDLSFNQGITDTYLDLSETYKLKGDFEQSLSYYEQYHMTNDSIIGQETANRISELQVLYDTETQARELEQTSQALATSEQKRKIMNLTTGVIGLAVFLLVVLAFFLAYRNRTRKKLYELELAEQKAQQKLLEESLQKKEQDLVNFGLDIARKNEFSNQVYQQLEDVVGAEPDSVRKKARELLTFASSHLKINKEIQQFQENVEQVNQDFFNRLLVKHPDLTPSEKQICGLIRLNLTTKDIASIKNTSTKAVEMARYRLRKKLSIDSKQDINQFLQAF